MPINSNRSTPSQSYKNTEDALDYIDAAESAAWATTPEQTVLIPEIEGRSLVSRFINFGGFAFTFMAIQFFAHLKMTYIACKEAYKSEEPNKKKKWIYRALENAFKTVFIGLAIVSAFFILSTLMLPAFTVLAAYDVLEDIHELWTTRNDYKEATSAKKRAKLLKERNELWRDLLLDSAMLVFSILSCLHAPIAATVGAIGCAVVAIIPIAPTLWSGIKSIWHDLKNKITHALKPAAKREPRSIELTNIPSYGYYAKHGLIDKHAKKHEEKEHLQPIESRHSEHRKKIKHKNNPEPLLQPALDNNDYEETQSLKTKKSV